MTDKGYVKSRDIRTGAMCVLAAYAAFGFVFSDFGISAVYGAGLLCLWALACGAAFLRRKAWKDIRFSLTDGALGKSQCGSHWRHVSQRASYACPPPRYEPQTFLHHRCRRAVAYQHSCFMCNLWTIHGSIVCTHMGFLHPPSGACGTGNGHKRLCAWTRHYHLAYAILRNCRNRYATAIQLAAEPALCSSGNNRNYHKPLDDARDCS